MLAVNLLIFALAVLLLIPVAVLCAECLAALLPARQRLLSAPASRPRVAVLIPAHNEQAELGGTLRSLTPQMVPGDRVVVVADNCTDRTEAVAREHGALVISRHDRKHHGKGFALDFGLRYLKQDPPQVVIMIDADCCVHETAIEHLAVLAAAAHRPAQACYLFECPSSGGMRATVSTLAFLVKNWVRPLGLARLRVPCLLTGTGMAFPWEIIRGAKLDSSNIVEDLQLGLDLTLAGHPPLFCGRAHVTGHWPEQGRAARIQRTRWEHGHLHTLITQVPRLVKDGLSTMRITPLALALELAVPPLSLLTILMVLACGVALVAARNGASYIPAIALGGGLVAVASCVTLSWAKFGRKILPVTCVLAAPFYILWKIPLYLRFPFHRQTEWVRTDREEQEALAWDGELSLDDALSLACEMDVGEPTIERPVPDISSSFDSTAAPFGGDGHELAAGANGVRGRSLSRAAQPRSARHTG